jgi:hypothetical protein
MNRQIHIGLGLILGTLAWGMTLSLISKVSCLLQAGATECMRLN